MNKKKATIFTISTLSIAVAVSGGLYFSYMHNSGNDRMNNLSGQHFIERDMSDSYESHISSRVEMKTNNQISKTRSISESYVSPSVYTNTESSNKDELKVSSIKKNENNVFLTTEESVSTFSIDTDDGSYRIFKTQLERGQSPSRDSVRVEEFINAFKYDYKPAKSLEEPFNYEVEVLESPWNNKKIIKIGVNGYEVSLKDMPSVNLTFLIDTSGSMSVEMDRIKQALKMLVEKLRPTDNISLVTYAGSSSVVLSNTFIEEKETILNAIDSLSSGGSTNGEGGIKSAYRENAKNFKDNGVNRIILISDGDFNVGISSTDGLKDFIKEKRKNGTTFSTVGISDNHYSDQTMEQMANVGNGNYTFLGDLNDIRETFSDRFISTLMNVAKDVKVQVEFNPNVVKEYRLIGYENRLLNKQDFNNDKIDAGEIPSGINATAFYEITLVGEDGYYPKSRYKKEKDLKEGYSDEYAFLKLRYKKRLEDKSILIEYPIRTSDFKDEYSDDSKLALSLAGLGQYYKNSDFIDKSYNYKTILKDLESIENKNEKIYELINIVKNLDALN